MNNLIHRLREVPPGGWVLIALALSAISGAALQTNMNAVQAELWLLRPRLAPEAQVVGARGDAAPQAFNSANNAREAQALRSELDRAGQLDASRKFHRLDLAFMVCYGALLLLGAGWAWKRARALAESKCGRVRKIIGRFLQCVSCVAFPAAVIAVGADLREHFTCLQMLGGAIDEGVVAAARQARWWKLFGFKVSAVTGLLSGAMASLMTPAVLEALQAIWELVVRAHRFALRARFSVLAGAVFTVLLLTGPGEDIVRTIATGAFWGEVAGSAPPKPDFARLGWFGVALLILAATCWGWARLVFAVRFATADQQPLDPDKNRRKIEDRLRRDLPIYYGSVPFVAAASAFAIAPLREGSAPRFPTTQFFAGSLAPLLLFLILPLALVIFRAKTSTSRKAVGPLSWTLIGYGALAALHAAGNWTDLHLLGLVPLILVATAFVVFGVGQPYGIFILPVALLGGAAAHDRFGEAAASAVALVVIGAVVSWLATRVQGVDELFIPKSFDRAKLLQLTISNKTRDEMSRLIEADEVGYTELRQMQEAAPHDPKDQKRPTAKLSEEVVGKLRSLLRFCGVLVVFQIAVFIVVLARPQEFSALIGSGAMLALGLAGLATAGSALLFITQATRFPILGAALFIAVLCSGAMDNHAIRLAGSPAAAFVAARETVPPKDDPGPIGAAFEQWQAFATSQGGEPPCIVVAAEGGGIRAALWPAIVLGTLQDESLAQRNGRPDFASHVFAISGVSGGSIGAAVFTALCAEKRDSGKIREMAATMCGADHLAPTLGALLYPDFVQRFLPVALLPDRAAAFEGSWEHTWPSGAGANRFAQPFSKLWPDSSHIWLPALFLNTTMVETGKRAICSDLPIRTAGGGQFIDAQDFHAHLREAGPGAGAWQDVPLSTAVHASARFPIVSPPGRLPSGARVVDGGYFENSAATTGIDVLNAVTKRLDQTKGSTKLIFIFLRYADSAGLSDTLEVSHDSPSPPIPDEDAPLHAKTSPLNETVGILGTLLATRTARGSYSQDAVFHRYLARQNVVVLSFTFRGEKIPLSWSLSRRSCNDMLGQFPKTAPVAAERIDEKTRSVINSNLIVRERLFRELYGP